ncbi:centrosomal protein of 68 kDa [Myripristis murdjan]|uniref:Centrosomal protein 68 n=1 Tax=Myripristis murdjan TaxID=586833 RepID=A0A668AIY2_9TELE|nr:centrosomal protein of 68 kDa [Myripristis murdjan]XP_029927066.1 centrosomal protein of 68 kDa [Myripristis murdjan]
MEAKHCSRRWRTQIPQFIHTRSPPQSTKDTERESMEKERERGGPRKSVTMAPTSRYLTDRQYVMRKPLFSVEQQTSILKKTHPQEHPEKDKHWTGCRTERYQQQANMDFLTRPREEVTSDSLGLSQGNASPPSTCREDLSSSLGVSDLMGRLSHEEPTFGSPYLGSIVARHSLSSPSLEVHTLTSPLRPRLASTLLSPTYTPRSRYSRSQRTEVRLGGKGGRAGEVERDLTMCSSIGYLKRRFSPALHTMSPNQANYWACAIPESLPPSPNRSSPSWDPDREYQALLDYTYPLRAGRVVSEWDGSELQDQSNLQTDPGFQDSGIELDHLCNSTSLSGLDFPLSGTGQIREKATLSAGHRLCDLRGLSKSSDGLALGSSLSLTDPIGLSLESLDSNKDRGGMKGTRNEGDCHYHHHHASQSSSSTAFIRSTRLLPRPGGVGGVEWDEEFRPLPDQLEELQVLSRQVREVTAQLSQPVTASWESLEPGTTSILSSITLPEKQDAEEVEEQVREQEGDGQETDEGKENVEGCVPETSQYHSKSLHHGDSSEAERKGPRAWMESVSGGLSRSSLREVEALVEQLSGLTLPDMQRRSQEDQEQSESLMQHIQMFCSNLEQLIRWLYAVSDRIEGLAPPTVDIESVKASLAEYQSFQREVSDHQPLTTSVLQTGELLLACINSTSPVLRDTLLLIERQSRALETHTEHLFSSILSAMDSLTQPSQPNKVKEPRAGGQGTMGVQGSTL